MKSSALLAALLVASAAQGQQARPANEPPSPGATEVESLAWTPLRGIATDLTVGSDGAAFTLDPEGQVWLRRSGRGGAWLRLPGHFQRIDAASERLAWAVDAEGGLFQYNGTFWRPVGTPKAVDVGVGGDGTVFIVLASGGLMRRDARLGSFLAVEGAPPKLLRVDVDDQGFPWVVQADGGVHRFTGRSWTHLPGALADLTVGADETAFGVSRDRQLLRWHRTNSRWTPIAARATVAAIGPDGGPWMATPDGEIYAQQPDPPALRVARDDPQAQVFTQVLGWRKVRGSAQSLGISSRGQVIALGADGEIWQWKGRDWTRLSGKLQRVALAADGRPWGIAEDGKIVQHQGSYWVELPGAAKDIAIGGNDATWIIQPDGRLAQWQPSRREWQILDGGKSAPTPVRLAVDPEGHPWIIDGARLVRQHDGKRWNDFPGIQASDLAIGPEGSVFAVADGKPWRYNRLNKRWERLSGEASAIAVGPKGMPWAVTAQHDIYASSFFDEDQASTPPPTTPPPSGAPRAIPAPPAVSAAAATAKEPLGLASFQLIRNAAARDIAVGNDGSVFALAFDGKVIRWNNGQNRFLSFPGLFSRIAVAPDGKPWGVTTRNEVWRHDGNSWRTVYNISAQDIAIGFNGTVIIAAPDEVLYKYNVAEARFERMLPTREGDPAPTGSRVAVDPQGRPWTITRDNRLWRCDRNPCELLSQKARDIDIGPEGSVFITDMDRKLRRLNTASGEWDRVGIDADGVAVGPGGKPWIVNGKSEVWASTFFKRDESGDITVAASSNTATTTSTGATAPPVFTFAINMPFEQVSLPAGFDTNSDLHLAFTAAGKLVALDQSDQFWNFDEAKKTFVRDTTVPTLPTGTVRTLAIGLDGAYWITNGDVAPYRIWRRSGSQWIQVQGLNDCATTPGCGSASTLTVGVATDGTVYATSDGNNIHRYDTAQQRFVPLTSVPRPPGGAGFVAPAPNGRLWAASPSPRRLYEFDGTAWQLRTDTVIGNPGQCLLAFGDVVPYGVPCVSVSASGAAYGFGANNRPVRWNAASRVWETITSSPTMGGIYAAAPDGRLWVFNDSLGTLHRAR